MRWRWRKQTSLHNQEASLAFPYYLDAPGLRHLADSLGIDLPLSQERSTGRSLSVSPRGVGSTRQSHSSSLSEGQIHLNRLATQLTSAALQDVAHLLGLVPRVSGSSLLSAAISHIEYMPEEARSHADLSEKLRTAYEIERSRAVALAKRIELEQVATQNQLVILRGQFEKVSPSDQATQLSIRLTHLESVSIPYKNSLAPEPSPPELPDEPADDLEMPDEVGVHVVLPAKDALTPSGVERLERGAPFYGRLIAHSASFDQTTGILTCCAYAVWGMPRPAKLLTEVRSYEFLEEER
jgi:hypothetical protein